MVFVWLLFMDFEVLLMIVLIVFFVNCLRFECSLVFRSLLFGGKFVVVE